jgi:hypothetical protein
MEFCTETKVPRQYNQRHLRMSEGRFFKTSSVTTGTYYYILNYKDIDGNFNTKNGYLYLTR